MVTSHANRKEWKTSRATTRDGSTGVDDTIVETCEIKWLSKEEWMRERKVKSTLVNKYKFVTFVLDRVTLPTVHRTNKDEGIEKKIKEKTPRGLGPADTTIQIREDGPAVQVCGDSDVTCQWINGQYSLGQKYRRIIGQVQKTLHSWWGKKFANPISKVDEFVKHVFREHNREADHWASVGAERQRKIVIDRCNNSETWKAMKGFWHGSSKDNVKSGCGVVIKGLTGTDWWRSVELRFLIKASTEFPTNSDVVICELIFARMWKSQKEGVSKDPRPERSAFGQTCFVTGVFRNVPGSFGQLPARVFCGSARLQRSQGRKAPSERSPPRS